MNLNDIWSASGTRIRYPELRQTDNTCVFVSIAGAINYLAGTSITESQIKSIWEADGQPPPHFGLALKYFDPEITQHSLDVQRYHDRDNPIPSVDNIIEDLRTSAVLIPSFELATATARCLKRAALWHMLSIFNLQSSQAQVWDTNGMSGFITDSAIRALLTDGFDPIPYNQLYYLVSHKQHEAIVVRCKTGV
jgi:hypothetical protein